MKSIFVAHPNAQFSDGRREHNAHYLVPEGDNPNPGDLAIVQIVVEDNSVSMLAGKVSSVQEKCDVRAKIFYQRLITLNSILDRREENTRLRETEALRERIRADLDKMLEGASDDTRYAALAEENLEAKRLLTRLRCTY